MEGCEAGVLIGAVVSALCLPCVSHGSWTVLRMGGFGLPGLNGWLGSRFPQAHLLGRFSVSAAGKCPPSHDILCFTSLIIDPSYVLVQDPSIVQSPGQYSRRK